MPSHVGSGEDTSKYIYQHHGHRLLGKHLNSLIVERTGFMLTDSTSFPEQPSFQYRFTKTTSAEC